MQDQTPQDDLDLLLAEPPAWPKVVGILSIVFGSLAFFCNGLGMAAFPFQEKLMAAAAQAQNVTPPPVMQAGPIMWAALLIAILVNVVLIIAGIATLARSPLGRKLHLFYALAGVIAVFFSTFVTMQAQADLNERMKTYSEQNPDSPFATKQGGPQEIKQLVGAAAGIGIGLAWPIFCGFWFTLSKRGTADMKGTGLEPAA